MAIQRLNIPVVVSVDLLNPQEDNPRKRVPERFALLMHSLRIAGHVQPIFATPAGEILSGHQRLAAVKELGGYQVPVVYVDLGNDLVRGAANIMFNLATNDMPNRVKTSVVAEGLDIEHLVQVLPNIPSKDINNPKDWPCMRPVMESVDFLDLANGGVGVLTEAGFETAERLAATPYNVTLPIVVDDSMTIINGKKRLAACKWLGEDKWPVTVVSDELAPYLTQLLNFLTMDFDFRAYADVLRSSVWLNHSRTRVGLGKGFTFWVNPRQSGKMFDVTNQAQMTAWKRRHGHQTAQIGAGHCVESALLNRAGVHDVPFEPFVLGQGSIMPDIERTRHIARVFLARVAEGFKFSSVFLSSVLNQVPFPEDRFKVLVLVHATAYPDAHSYISTMTRSSAGWQQMEKGANYGEAKLVSVAVDYEDGARIGQLGGGANARPLVQKFHTKEELEDLLRPLWRTWDIQEYSSDWYVDASRPYRINAEMLAKALDHEFNLPFWSGGTLGLNEVAKDAYAKRFGIKIGDHDYSDQAPTLGKAKALSAEELAQVAADLLEGQDADLLWDHAGRDGQRSRDGHVFLEEDANDD